MCWFKYKVVGFFQHSQNKCFTLSVTNIVEDWRRGAFKSIISYSFKHYVGKKCIEFQRTTGNLKLKCCVEPEKF